MKNIVMKAVCSLVALFFLSTSESFSKSYSSSSRSSPSSSYSSKSYSSSKPSSSSYSSKPSSSKVSVPASARVHSNVDKKRYETAVKNGTSFKTRESAVADFKTKNAVKYTSTFTTEPKKRPTYIPMKYRSSNGSSYDVVYDPTQRGYGYWNGGGPGLGAWMAYDALSDTAMLNSLMAKNNYYVGSAPKTSMQSNVLTITAWILGVFTIGFIALMVYDLLM